MIKGLLCVTLGLIVVSAAAKPLPITEGAKFISTRQALLKQGWKPLNVHQKDGYEYIGVEHDLIKANIREVDSCAVDRALCIFRYKRKAQCLRVLAKGEDVPTMVIDSWSNDCPRP